MSWENRMNDFNRRTRIGASFTPNRGGFRTLGELIGLPSVGADTLDSDNSGGSAFALQRVVMRVQVTGDCAITETEQHYRNPCDIALDVVHTIPMSAAGAIVAFEIRCGKRWIAGDCRTNAAARAAFTKAKRSAYQSAMLDQERDDIQTLKMANIPPHAELVVKLTIIERLRVTDGRFEIRVPTTIGMKYVPGIPVDHEGTGSAADTDQASDASRATPIVRLDGATPLDFQLRLAKPISAIEGSVDLVCNDEKDDTMLVTLAQDATCNCDVVVRFWSREARTLVRAYGDGKHVMVVVDPPAQRQPKAEMQREAVYLLDCSGSMQGANLQLAKSVVTHSLRALRPSDQFEVSAFNTDELRFSDTAKRATSSNIEAACTWIDALTAGGGTEMIAPIQSALHAKSTPQCIRTVLLVTDGAVANDAVIFQLAATMSPHARLYTIGVGYAPSTAFLSRLSRICNGSYLPIAPSVDWLTEFADFDAALVGPIALGLSVDGCVLPYKVDLFAGRSASFIIKEKLKHVRVIDAHGKVIGESPVTPISMSLGALWARDEIMRLEDRRAGFPDHAADVDVRIEDLGVRYQLQTRLTSFVAIDQSKKIAGKSIAMVQPVDAVRVDQQASSMNLRVFSRCHGSGDSDFGDHRVYSLADDFAPDALLGAPESHSITRPIALQQVKAAWRVLRAQLRAQLRITDKQNEPMRWYLCDAMYKLTQEPLKASIIRHAASQLLKFFCDDSNSQDSHSPEQAAVYELLSSLGNLCLPVPKQPRHHFILLADKLWSVVGVDLEVVRFLRTTVPQS